MSEFQTVCKIQDLRQGEGKTVTVGNKLVALFHIDGDLFAIDDTCPHMGMSLSSGYVEAGIVTCPWHAWRFRLKDGVWADNPRIKIGCYQVRVVGDEVQVEIGGSPAENIMNPLSRSCVIGMLMLGVALLPGDGQTPAKVVPRLEAIAETRLLMEGLAHANFRGLERHLSPKPADDQAWVFARGQALLLAETANLLMLRPPKNKGEAVWFERTMELRTQAVQLAQQLARKDLERSRAGLLQVAASCNRCHQAFRVPIEIAPFQQPEAPPRKAE